MSKISLKLKISDFFSSFFNKGKLPDFIIVGAQKAGSTYLQQILDSNPHIEMSPNFCKIIKDEKRVSLREIHFFNSNDFKSKGVRWYKLFFNDNGKIQGEKTPTYICQKFSHERMFKTIPKAKLILLIRNPVDRLFSAYTQRGAGYDENKSFEENIEQDMAENPESGLISRGFYIDQIQNLLRFYPKDQLLIIVTEQMKENPKRVYEKVCGFLRVDCVDVDFNKKINVNKYKSKMNKETEEKLYNLYEPYNQRLYEFLGYKITEWEK